MIDTISNYEDFIFGVFGMRNDHYHKIVKGESSRAVYLDLQLLKLPYHDLKHMIIL